MAIVLLKNLSDGLRAMNENNKKASSSSSRSPKKLKKRGFSIFGSKVESSNNAFGVKETFSDNTKAFKQYVGIRSIFNPLWCLFGLRISVVILTVFGLFMVFSSSSVTMITYGAGPWGSGMSQLFYCVIGLAGYLIFSHLPVDFIKAGLLPFTQYRFLCNF